MNDRRYKWLLYFITVVILCTIGIQVYWNFKNYQINKQQLVNDVQISLDNAVDSYYTNLAERSATGYVFESSSDEGFLNPNFNIDKLKSRKNPTRLLDSTNIMFINGLIKSNPKDIEEDSLLRNIVRNHNSVISDPIQLGFEWRKEFLSDSVSSINNFSLLTSKVFISITRDSLSLKNIDSLLKSELSRKSLNIDYGLIFKVPGVKAQKLNAIKLTNLTTNSESPFLPEGSSLSIHFSNETKIILRRILTGILISTLLVLAVIGCLFYLLRIIRHQKQLAEMKNDLISNITHEFKTPIATISVVLEGLRNFNVTEDKEKTKNYLNISSDQLTKLNVMVEKLLETATLDSENLELSNEPVNVISLLNTIVDNYQMQTETKTLSFDPRQEFLETRVDVFHFENAINNILDNAIKYGGNKIQVEVTQNAFSFTISISDNGNSLKKANKDQIFEKFYRVSKGNTHDIKGFGIGLYYTKKIVEKHEGTIQLELKKNHTTFKLTFPNGA